MAELTNDDRAEMVRPLVQQFHDAHYWHESGEPLATVIGDIIANLGHLIDRLPASEFDLLGVTRLSFEEILEGAREHYEYEIAEEDEDALRD